MYISLEFNLRVQFLQIVWLFHLFDTSAHALCRFGLTEADMGLKDELAITNDPQEEVTSIKSTYIIVTFH